MFTFVRIVSKVHTLKSYFIFIFLVLEKHIVILFDVNVDKIPQYVVFFGNASL